MKRQIIISAIVLFSFISFTACEDDDEVAVPVVTDLQVGTVVTDEGNKTSNVGYIGGELCVEATVVAEAKIKKIEIRIHQEAEEKAASTEAVEWDETFTFTAAEGKKNTTFHEHIDIPATAPAASNYCLHFIVTDMDGNETMVEFEDIVIKSVE